MGASDGSLLESIYDRMLPAPCPRPDNLLAVPEILLNDRSCLSSTMSRYMGIAIVFGAGAIKIPQIIKILANQSAAGLSVNAYLIEIVGYCFNFGFAYQMDYPISAYGEAVLILLQNFIILSLIYHYEKGMLARGLGIVAVFAVGCAMMLAGFVPLEVLRALTGLNALVAVGARLPQILENHRNKDAGNLSLLTCIGLAGGSAVRIYTTLKDMPEPTVLLGFVVSCTMNVIILAQVIYYSYVAKPVKTGEKEE